MSFHWRDGAQRGLRIADLLAYFDRWDGRPTVTEYGLRIEDGRAIGSFDSLVLHSAFQPLISAGSGDAVAFEALLRAEDPGGIPVSPAQAFRRPVKAGEIAYFDRLCRIVHVLNFATQADPADLLFLNIDGRHLLKVDTSSHGQTFTALLHHCGAKPKQIVLEILESHLDDVGHLSEAVAAYQEQGYRVALDDFGSRLSNFDRLWRVSPDIVKLDRDLIVKATVNERARRVLPKLVEIIHDLGAQVVCEGIETAAQHALATEAGVDLLQGFHYAHPAPLLPNRSVSRQERESLKLGG